MTTFGILQTGPIAISSAQLLAADTTPITIIPAPGAGQVIVVLAATYELIFGSTAYSENGGNTMTYGTGSIPADAPGDSNTLASSANSIILSGSTAGGTIELTADVVNQPVVFGGSGNGFNPLTGGDGSAVIQATYMIVPVSG